jgi:transcriptional regulator with XRE-family HTH domain
MNIQKLRLQRGWSQQQLADLCGLSSRTIQRIENGQTASVESLKSLASVFEIDFSSLTSEQIMESTKATNQDEQLALAKVRKIRRFYIHLVQYALVISVLAC